MQSSSQFFQSHNLEEEEEEEEREVENRERSRWEF